MWVCRCDCGEIRAINKSNLTTGRTLSCGCYNKEQNSKDKRRHGLTHTGPYNVWNAMRQRCTNPNKEGYQYYGGRGIKVCERWIDSFENFYADVSILPHFGEEGYSLDRIDADRDYEPGNVRWATQREQCNNQRSNHIIEYNGESHTIAEWSMILGFPRYLIGNRLRKGWTEERALSTPSRK